MRLSDAREMAEGLIREHDLRGFRFGWVEDHSAHLAHRANPRGSLLSGGCLPVSGLILLSRAHAALRSPARVRETILHEIAHALLGTADHGPDWQDLASSLGVPNAVRFAAAR